MAGPIVLFGGTGMVGHNVLDLAAVRGIEILAPERRELDLSDGQAVIGFLQRARPDIVIHAAGKVGGIEANMREPVAFLSENWEMGRNVMMGARQADVRRLINLGSSCMYPKDAPGPLREDDLLHGPFEPTNEAYAIAKVAVQRLGRFISEEDGRLQYKTLIPCNLYGRYDSFDPIRSHLAAAVIQKLHTAKTEGRKTVEIWGDGTARREFLFAGDLAQAILSAVERFATLPAVMNVGSGTDHTVAEYYSAAAEVVGYDGSFTFDLSKPVGMKRKLMDSSLARAWGWEARTSLRDGLAAAYAYYVSTLADAPAV
jgi:GDP-L-fucose synthase